MGTPASSSIEGRVMPIEEKVMVLELYSNTAVMYSSSVIAVGVNVSVYSSEAPVLAATKGMKLLGEPMA